MPLLTLPPESIRRRESNAEVLRWQARFRVVFGVFVGLVGGGLHAVGVLAPSRVAARLLSPVSPFLAQALLAASYLGVVLLVHRRVRRSTPPPALHGLRALPAPKPAAEPAGSPEPAVPGASSEAPSATAPSPVAPPASAPATGVGRGAVLTATVADLALVFGSVFLLTPPAHYDRALLLSVFGLQVTQIYFGRVASTLWAVATELGYAWMVSAAERAGEPVRWAEELWTLALFAFGATLFILLQGNQAARLGRLVRMFEKVEEGDFSQTYDVAADSRPDNVTLVGRAYNRMRAQLATIVLTDPLSGCLNRRGFEQQLARDVRRAARSNGELSLLAIDLDHFKQINDTFGHLAGDAVIREAGELLRAAARPGDVVARVGGEEFILLAADTGEATAAELARRIVAEFRARRFSVVDGRRPITASVGVVSDRIRDEHAGGDLHARADEALYAAKRAGRDQVVVWEMGKVLSVTAEHRRGQ